MSLSFKKAAKMSLALIAGSTAAVSFAQVHGAGRSLDSSMGQFTNGYMENKGQWDPQARYRTSRNGLDFWMTSTGFVFDFHKYEKGASNSKSKGGGVDDGINMTKYGHVVRMDMVGATGNGVGEGYKQTSTKMDYLVGEPSKQARGVRAFGEAYVKDVIPGVHTRGYDDDGKMRYDVVVMPGAKADQIQWKITGADAVSLDAKGNLLIKTDLGNIVNEAPYIYQPVGNKHMIIDGKWQVQGNVVSFQLAKHDPRLPLIIDPLVYGTYLGSDAVPFFSTGQEEIHSCSADSKGNLFMTGWTDSVTFPVTDGPYGINTPANFDMFLMRLEADAYSMDYAALIGGSNIDIGYGIAFNEASGDLWLGGVTSSTNFAGATNVKQAGTRLVLTKFTVDQNGVISPNFSQYYNTPGQASFTSMGGDPRVAAFFPPLQANQAIFSDLVVASDGTAYLVGRAPSANVAGFNPFTAQFTGGGTDGFVSRFDVSGAIVDETVIGSTGDDDLGQAALDSQNNLVLAGAIGFAGNEDTAVVPNPTFPTTAGVYANGRLLRNSDGYVVKMDANMGLIFSATLGGNNLDGCVGAAFDTTGNIYVLSNTASFDFPRTPGVYDPVFSGGEAAVTKISPTGTTILYSTALGHTMSGPITSDTISVDDRGVAVVGGTVGFVYPGGMPPQPTVAGAIPVTPDALDGVYGGGTQSVGPPNTPQDATTFPSTCEGFIQFLNPAGTNLLYSDYMGDNSDDVVTNVFVDAVGATWITGFSALVTNGNGAPFLPAGISAYITGNAFKQNFDSLDGWAVKLRVGLPILQNVAFNPDTIAGGLGASSTATITLRDPAPVGGVTMTATLENGAATSFSPTAGDTTRVVTIPAGVQTATLQVFSLPVATQVSADLRVVLDNDFKLARLTVRPWLDDFSVSPSSIVGGNQLTARVQLFQAAINDTAVSVTTDRPDLITLPNPPEIVVPAGATTVNVLLDTVGVDVTENATMTATLLGVGKSTPVTLTRATVAAVLFNPARINGGDDSTMTVQMNGKVGADRVVDIDVISGPAGLLVDGNPVPTQLTIPAQQKSVDAIVTAPVVPAPTSVVVRASEAGIFADGTLFIDDIDIQSIQFQPATDVISGSVLTGTVNLSRAAGPQGFTVTLASSNAAAGTLSTNTVTIPAGATVSPTFTFTCAVVASDETTTVSASRTGFTTRTVDITVRAINLTLSLLPTSVVGGFEDSVGTITLDNPAPAAGLTVNLSSSNSAAASVPATVTVAGGATTATFPIVSSEVNAVANVTITATASPAVFDSAVLVVNPVGVSVALVPSAVTGGSANSNGTVTLTRPAPVGGFTLNLTSSVPAAASVDPTVTVPAGAMSADFTVTTFKVSQDTNVTITATSPAGNSGSAVLLVRAPAIIDFVIDPTVVVGPDSTFGTVTLETTAPAGGVIVSLTSDNPVAQVPATVTVPAGQASVTFEITTTSVSSDEVVNITASTGNSVATASFFVLAPTVASITFAPPKVTGGAGSTGTVTLDQPAPAGGMTVIITSDNPTLANSVQASINIPAGQRTGTFTVTTARVSRNIAVGFRATTPSGFLVGYLYLKP
jgi:hypothetical protein